MEVGREWKGTKKGSVVWVLLTSGWFFFSWIYKQITPILSAQGSGQSMELQQSSGTVIDFILPYLSNGILCMSNHVWSLVPTSTHTQKYSTGKWTRAHTHTHSEGRTVMDLSDWFSLDIWKLNRYPENMFETSMPSAKLKLILAWHHSKNSFALWIP